MENINDFILPLHISDENNYIKCVEKKTEYYISKIKEFISLEKFSHYRVKLIQAVNTIRIQLDNVVRVYDNLIHGRNKEAKDIMSRLLANNLSVLITPLNKSNAFCGDKLFSYLDKELKTLYLYRGRVVKPYEVLSADEMFHIPLNKRGIVGSYRYSILGIPCLYLASNSYVVWNEMSKPNLSELAISAFEVDEELLSNQIIDLTLPIYWYCDILKDEELHIENNGKALDYIIESMAAIPLIIACSVVCDCKTERKFYVEYLLPQLMMQFLGDNLFGIAYRSNRINSSGLSANNLAIPIINFDAGKKFGNISRNISVGDSLNIGYFSDFLESNSSLSVRNESAEGPSAVRMNKMFSLALVSAESTFNKKISIEYRNYSYDGFIQYTDSVFYKFDEYLLFKNKLKYLND